MLDPILLRSLLAVVDSGGFTRAADRLNLTQSTISAHIRRLESDTGHRLLERTTRVVTLTPAGARLLSYAQAIVALNQDARISLGGGRPLTGTLCVGLSEEMVRTSLSTQLREFAATHPGVELTLTVGLTGELLTRLDAGAIDIVLGSRCDDATRGEVLWSEPLLWAVAPVFLADDDPTAPLPLAVYPEACPYRAAAITALTQSGRHWRIACQSASLEGLAVALAAGLAVAPLARSAVRAAGLRPMAGLPPLPEAQFILIESARSKPAAKALGQDLRHCAPVSISE
jgi:DNA-binding transcriptional LysR family regulator